MTPTYTSVSVRTSSAREMYPGCSTKIRHEASWGCPSQSNWPKASDLVSARTPSPSINGRLWNHFELGGGGGNRTRVHERPGGVSTSLAVAFSLARRPRVGRVRFASPEESRARHVGTSLPRPSPSICATTPATDPPGVTGCLVRQPARECYSRQLCCSGSLTRPPDLGLLLRPRIRPCRNHVAPTGTNRGRAHPVYHRRPLSRSGG